MKKYLSIFGLGLLLCCLYAGRAQASIIPNDPQYWDYYISSINDGNTWDVLNNRYSFAPPRWEGDTLIVNNLFDPKREKILAIEVKYNPTGIGPINFLVTADPSNVLGPTVVDKTGDLTFYWKIIPQPVAEKITFPPGWRDSIFQIEIATKCIPEPSTFIVGAIALGLLGLRRFRR